jgi:CubicO group peptidase (beta-lactamase class C family)
MIISTDLPDNGDMTAMGQSAFSESPMDGIGFGLGVAVVINPAKSQLLRSPGEFYWGGMASTAFWIDPQEDIVCVFFTQLVPSGTRKTNLPSCDLRRIG